MQNRDPESPSFALNRTNIDDQSFNLEKKTSIDHRYANLMPNHERAESLRLDTS